MLTVKTYLDKSPVNGTGCFTDEFIPKGTIIWKFQENFDVVVNDEQFEALPKIAQEWIHHFGYYNKQEGGHVLCMDNSKYFNHSEIPNTDDNGEYTVAKIDIQRGEELLSDYGSFDESARTTKLI